MTYCEGPEVDVWSMGVCLFLLATSYFPFGGETSQEVWNEIRKNHLWIPDCIANDVFLVDLLHRMLAFEASERLTIPEILRHPWLMVEESELKKVPSLPLPIASVDNNDTFQPNYKIGPSQTMPEVDEFENRSIFFSETKKHTRLSWKKRVHTFIRRRRHASVSKRKSYISA